ncbi:MAG: flagellar M-ring protein FliF [Alphaproteobacteria bacterium]|nr:flagellar M-ring protein FliF [Alphaproteobacteria bacterium]
MNNILQTLKNMSPGRLASIAAIIIFLISFFIYIGVQMNSTEYAVLYTDLELEDAKQIVSRLEAANVKYKLTKNGTEVMVPTDEVNRMRVDTAELAMASKGSNVGYEVFDNADTLGSTNFVQNINLIRALEGELARTIRSVDNIKSARVHLVLPKREMFSREEQLPTASVVIKTRDGTLGMKSVQSIQQLVAAAVPKLDVKNVSIVDSAGNLLTNDLNDPENPTVKNVNNELLRLEQERKLAARVQDLLEKTVGAGRAKAQVNIEMDFDEVVTNEEIYDPDSQVIRSQATLTEQGTSGQNNQPVTVAQNIPNGDVVNTNSGQYNQNSKVEETINYEISKVIRNKIKNTGTIKRLTTAVVVDGVYEKNAEGKEVYRPRTELEMEKITALVKSAVGFDANRGDTVDVENMRFTGIASDADDAPQILYMGFTKDELLRIAEGLGVAIVAILVILLVVRPLINNVFEPATGGNEKLLSGSEEENLLLSNFLNDDDEGTDELINLNKVDGRVKVSSLKKLNNVVEKNPEAAVNVIRSWLYNNDN